jgi:hypothetical protein
VIQDPHRDTLTADSLETLERALNSFDLADELLLLARAGGLDSPKSRALLAAQRDALQSGLKLLKAVGLDRAADGERPHVPQSSPLTRGQRRARRRRHAGKVRRQLIVELCGRPIFDWQHDPLDPAPIDQAADRPCGRRVMLPAVSSCRWYRL